MVERPAGAIQHPELGFRPCNLRINHSALGSDLVPKKYPSQERKWTRHGKPHVCVPNPDVATPAALDLKH
jgi:hypothetical protein